MQCLTVTRPEYGRSELPGLDETQDLIRQWAAYNFPNKPSWQPLLGVAEEVGELSHAHLKQVQGVRHGDWTALKKDAVGDIAIYLIDYCNKEGISFADCLHMTMSEIFSRDWIKFPKNGKTE